MMIKVIFICVTSLFMILIIKNTLPSIAPVVAIASGIISISLCIPELKKILNMINSFVYATSGMMDYFKVIIKVAVIAVICEFSSQLCSDNGENYLASKIEFAGKLSIILISMPEFSKFINKISGLVLSRCD